MSKKVQEMVAEIASDLGSPRVVQAIDTAIAALIDLRKVAISLHGEGSLASAPTPAVERLATEVVPAQSQQSLSKSNGFDGTINGLVARYCAHKSYLELRFRTRGHYETLMKFIKQTCGDRKVSDFKKRDIELLHSGWVKERKETMGHALIVMFRTLIYFGASTLNDDACERLSVVLHRMRFPMVKTFVEKLTVEHVVAVREQARKMDRDSIALAQALQFDCNLRQKDVIGEWVPIDEPGESDLHYAGNKWLRGIRWEEIDDHLILRHPSSRDSTGTKEIIVDLKQAPMVMEELQRLFGDKRSLMPTRGPVIINERDDCPWYAQEYRRHWRMIADKAGVPRSVKNRDSRSSSKPDRADRHEDDEDDVDLMLELPPTNMVAH